MRGALTVFARRAAVTFEIGDGSKVADVTNSCLPRCPLKYQINQKEKRSAEARSPALMLYAADEGSKQSQNSKVGIPRK